MFIPVRDFFNPVHCIFVKVLAYELMNVNFNEEKHEWTINMEKLFGLAELNRACQEHSVFRMYEAVPEVDDHFTHF